MSNALLKLLEKSRFCEGDLSKDVNQLYESVNATIFQLNCNTDTVNEVRQREVSHRDPALHYDQYIVPKLDEGAEEVLPSLELALKTSYEVIDTLELLPGDRKKRHQAMELLGSRNCDVGVHVWKPGGPIQSTVLIFRIPPGGDRDEEQCSIAFRKCVKLSHGFHTKKEREACVGLMHSAVGFPKPQLREIYGLLTATGQRCTRMRPSGMPNSWRRRILMNKR